MLGYREGIHELRTRGYSNGELERRCRTRDRGRLHVYGIVRREFRVLRGPRGCHERGRRCDWCRSPRSQCSCVGGRLTKQTIDGDIGGDKRGEQAKEGKERRAHAGHALHGPKDGGTCRRRKLSIGQLAVPYILQLWRLACSLIRAAVDMNPAAQDALEIHARVCGPGTAGPQGRCGSWAGCAPDARIATSDQNDAFRQLQASPSGALQCCAVH